MIICVILAAINQQIHCVRRFVKNVLLETLLAELHGFKSNDADLDEC
jgi:hypothetical protein